MTTSWPLAPTVSRLGATRHPWFTFAMPSLLDEERTFQWQIHPVGHGLLRYTLVELPGQQTTVASSFSSSPSDETTIPFSAAQEDNQGRIRAIYHNVGLGFCLSSQPHSEGAVLLQGDLGPELEALVVASLVGLLWRVRNEETTRLRRGRGRGSTVLPGEKPGTSVGESGDVPSPLSFFSTTSDEATAHDTPIEKLQSERGVLFYILYYAAPANWMYNAKYWRCWHCGTWQTSQCEKQKKPKKCCFLSCLSAYLHVEHPVFSSPRKPPYR